METTIGDYIEATKGIHAPVPYLALISQEIRTHGLTSLGIRPLRVRPGVKGCTGFRV